MNSFLLDLQSKFIDRDLVERIDQQLIEIRRDMELWRNINKEPDWARRLNFEQVSALVDGLSLDMCVGDAYLQIDADVLLPLSVAISVLCHVYKQMPPESQMDLVIREIYQTAVSTRVRIGSLIISSKNAMVKFV